LNHRRRVHTQAHYCNGAVRNTITPARTTHLYNTLSPAKEESHLAFFKELQKVTHMVNAAVGEYAGAKRLFPDALMCM
jgi:hypothetical protein